MAAARPSSEAGLAPNPKAKAAKPTPAFGDKIAKIKTDIAPDTFHEVTAAAVSNAKYFTLLRDSIDVILGHPYFEAVLEEMPLGLDDSGYKHAFAQEDFDTAMVNGGMYECSCNFWWQSFKPTQAVQPFVSCALVSSQGLTSPGRPCLLLLPARAPGGRRHPSQPAGGEEPREPLARQGP